MTKILNEIVSLLSLFLLLMAVKRDATLFQGTKFR
jgi:hypothetical protein